MNRFVSRIALAGLLALGAAEAGAQTVLRVSHWIPNTAMPAPLFEEWARSMQAASNGALQVQIFPNGQLGRAVDHYDMARDGIADLAWAVPGFNAGRFPIFGALELPFMASNAPEGIYAFDEWYRRHVQREMGDVHYCMAHTSPVSTLNFVNRQVNTPAELRGLRMRPQNAVAGRWFAALGANVVQVSAAEARQAFDRGLLDGIAFPWRTLFAFNLQQPVRMHMDMPITTAPSVWVMNRRRYESLAGAARAAVDAHCSPEWARRIIKGWDDWENEGRAQLIANGNTIYPVSAENRALWRESAQVSHDEWIRDVGQRGLDARAELADLQQRLRARNAGF